MSKKEMTTITIDKEGFSDSYREIFNALCEKLKRERGFSRGTVMSVALSKYGEEILGLEAKMKIIGDSLDSRDAIKNHQKPVILEKHI